MVDKLFHLFWVKLRNWQFFVASFLFRLCLIVPLCFEFLHVIIRHSTCKVRLYSILFGFFFITEEEFWVFITVTFPVGIPGIFILCFSIPVILHDIYFWYLPPRVKFIRIGRWLFNWNVLQQFDLPG